MKTIHVTMTIWLAIAAACQKDESRNSNPVAPPPPPTAKPSPILVMGLNGGLSAGSVLWTLPKFLDGQLQNLGQDIAEASFEIDLVNANYRKSSRINSGFQVKSCYPVSEAEAFTRNFASDSAENIPDSLKTDVDEISTWTSETKNFKGRAFLKKRYKAEGDTGIYRIDALVTNLSASECVLWNLVFTPKDDTTAAFIESSAEYKELMISLGVTWEGLGAKFND